MQKRRDPYGAGTVVTRMQEQMARKALRAKARSLGLTVEEYLERLSAEERRRELVDLLGGLRLPPPAPPEPQETPWVLLPE